MNSRSPANPVALKIETSAGALAMLEEVRADISPLLAENGQTFDRLRSTLLIAIQQEPKILQCTADSLRREISKCAADGLVPDAREAVILPYWDSKAGAMIANYQPMVHGVIKRLRELGDVFSIICKLVYENDEYEENEARPEDLIHRSPGFGQPRGEVVGGYVIFRDKDLRWMHFESMPRSEMDKARAASKAPDSPAWKIWRDEMFRKIVLRRGAKYISTNNDKIRALLERDDSLYDFQQTPRPTERINPFGGPVIEAEATEVPVADDAARKGQSAVETAPKASAPKPARKAQAEKPVEPETVKPQPDAGPAPSVPDIDVPPMDREAAIDAAEKILAIGLKADVDLKARRDLLAEVAASSKSAVPESLHPLAKACVDVTHWAIRREAAGQPWAADHARFVHQLRELLDVEKLNIGKYP
jgi:recombination protein RecT